ncbi:hypothetical protein P0082_06095 [Candidatus Haliotispira prima]|uniref:Uncharacterized protein n=1 Tax=Candidatus Haliotispira prima TaxID=3034016 RepID=A0ABY8MER7_9SPIO|nr:hypothetical protein P0082_06095 [Candidatus Haliotispira prima]
MASSVQLEVNSIPAVTDAGAIIRLATEATPTQVEARASVGYVNISIDANSTRKFSISQHYGSNFADGGFTLADVLAPNTKYKLYLYMPSATDLGQTEIKGGTIKGDTVEISFTTANLPAAGDAVWSEKFAAKEYVTSLNEYHFMENQTGIIVAYFWLPSESVFIESGTISNNKASIRMGQHTGSTITPDSRFYYNGGLISSHPSAVAKYTYIIGADKLASPTLRNAFEVAVTLNQGGLFVPYSTVVNRY